MATVLVALALLLGVSGDPVSVFVSAPMRDGFVDTNKDIQDSINDIRSRLSSMKEFRLASTREGRRRCGDGRHAWSRLGSVWAATSVHGVLQER